MSQPFIITGAGGGSATPGGNTGDIQFNNVGVLGGETLVPLVNGGTNADLSASGSATAFLAQSASHVVSARSIISGDLPLADVKTGITFKRAASAINTAGTSVDVAITAEAGTTIVVFANAASNPNSALNVFVGDDGGNDYSCLIDTNTSSGSMGCWVAINVRTPISRVHFYGVSGNVTCAVGVYSGVQKIGAHTNGNNGATTAGSQTLSMTVANSYMLAGFSWFKSGSAITISANAGNLRTSQGSSSSTTTAGIGLVDNTQAGTGNETSSVTASAAPTGWANVAVELIPNS